MKQDNAIVWDISMLKMILDNRDFNPIPDALCV